MSLQADLVSALKPGESLTGAQLCALALKYAGVRKSFGAPSVHSALLCEAMAKHGIDTISLTRDRSAGIAASAVWSSCQEVACVHTVGDAGLSTTLPSISGPEGKPAAVVVVVVTDAAAQGARNGGLKKKSRMRLKLMCKEFFTVAEPADISASLMKAVQLTRTDDIGVVVVEIPMHVLGATIVGGSGPLTVLGTPALAAELSTPEDDITALLSTVCRSDSDKRTMVVTDPGFCASVAAEHFAGHQSVIQSDMGWAVPTAIGVAVANPDAVVVVLVEANSIFAMGMELASAASSRLGLTVIALHLPSDAGPRRDLCSFATAVGLIHQTASSTADLPQGSALLSKASRNQGVCMLLELSIAAAVAGAASPSADVSSSAARVLSHALQQVQTGHLFGCSMLENGTRINNLLDSIRTAGASLTSTEVADYSNCARMLSGYANTATTDDVVCVAVETNNSNGKARDSIGLCGAREAMLASRPLLLLCISTDVNSPRSRVLADPFCKTVLVATTAAEVVSQLYQAATVSHADTCGPVAVSLPASLLAKEWDLELLKTSVEAPTRELSAPSVKTVSAAHQIFDAFANATRPLVHVCGGIKCAAQLTQLINEFGLNCCVSTDSMSKGVLPEDHPQWLWAGIGATLPSALRRFSQSCDMALVIGCQPSSFEGHDLPKNVYFVSAKQAKQDAMAEGATFVCADEVVCLQTMLGFCTESTSSNDTKRAALTKELASAHAEAKKEMLTRAPAGDAQSITRILLLNTLQNELPTSTCYTTDRTSEASAIENLRLASPGCLVTSGGLWNDEYAVPAAIGACLALGDRMVVAFADDASFPHSIPELMLAAEQKLPIVILVIDDGSMGLVGNMQHMSGRQVTDATSHPAYNSARVAQSAGIVSKSASTVTELKSCIQWATAQYSARSGPVVVRVALTVDEEHPSYQLSSVADVRVPPVVARSRKQASKGDGEPEVIVKRRAGDTTFAENKMAACLETDHFDIWEPLAHAREQFGERIAIVDVTQNVTLTYEEVSTRVCRLATKLMQCGVKKGERVGVLMPNSLGAMESHYVIAGGARGVVLNLNQRLAPIELAYIFEDAGPVWIIAAIEFAELVKKTLAATNHTGVRGVMWSGVDSSKSVSIEGISVQQMNYEAIASDASLPSTLTPASISADDGAEMYYTSGTTGRPKGVCLNQRNVVLHALGCMVEHRHTINDVWGHFAPMFHLVDAYAAFSITWIGGKHLMLAQFQAAAVLDVMEKYHVTATNMASTMITLLLSHPDVQTRDLSAISLMSCGGAPLNRRNTIAAIQTFDCEMFLSYGMTECCGKISMSLLTDEVLALPSARQLDYVCTSGRAFKIPGFEVRIVADGGTRDVRHDSKDVGEIWIRGPTVFTEYWNNPEATKKSFVDGWFLTGDMAFIDDRDYLTITDRAKDMILTGAENVYSVEVERALADHGDVLHACVFGIPDDLMGELVKAVVVLVPGRSVKVCASRLYFVHTFTVPLLHFT